MTRRKKTLHIRVRRTSYERALTDATSALEKARAQQTKCLTDLERLTRQIPYLENVVQALTPPAEPGPVTANVDAQGGTTLLTVPQGQMDQEAYLEKFLPKPGRLTVNEKPQFAGESPGNTTDPDEFLNDEQ